MANMPRATFGQVVRGYRLGFGYHEALDRWVRVSDDGQGGFFVEVEKAPPPSTRARRTKSFFVWWDDRGARSELFDLLASEEASGVESMIVDDDGKIISVISREEAT